MGEVGPGPHQQPLLKQLYHRGLQQAQQRRQPQATQEQQRQHHHRLQQLPKRHHVDQRLHRDRRRERKQSGRSRVAQDDPEIAGLAAQQVPQAALRRQP